VALASLHRHALAMENYEMAMQLEPENQTYINNYNLSANKVNPIHQMAARIRADQSTATPSSQPTTSFSVSGNLPCGGAGGAGFDFNTMLNHPTLINMASQVLLDPNMQNM
jgi:Tfp pilus assembly protein PilF